jgi:hypothetical protein
MILFYKKVVNKNFNSKTRTSLYVTFMTYMVSKKNKHVWNRMRI